MKTRTLNITQNDIDTGTRADSHFCAITLAAQRMKGIKTPIITGTSSIYFGKYGTRCCVPLAPKLFDFRKNFDSGKKYVTPLKVKLQLPDECFE